MIRLGLTGSIATGKSTALAEFRALGVPTFSADGVVHQLYREPEVLARIERIFPGVVHDGRVDREMLGQSVLIHPEDLKDLEAVVHPLVRRRMAAFLESAQSTGAPLAVVDVPLLFETGFDYGFDAVAVTTCSDAEQRRRALARPGMTDAKLDAILARQMPQAEKVRRADHVIDTNGTLEETRARVRQIAKELGATT